ncbi:MAG: hypothetical protein A2020_16605 [Lentisphaerae bacterium GWF2_45_14]|nr:MAG: hypothetical protein A2020_16605 [Lentisphaerae bacterium GWF2_45_14]
MNLMKAILLPILTAGMVLSVYGQSTEDKNIKIENIDKNFQLANIGNKEICYYDALLQPFALSGFPWRDPQKVFNRLPASFTEKDVNPGALSLSRHSTGGAIRFRTDSPYIALRAKLAYSSDMSHMPRAASSGFDLYSGSGADIRYCKTVQPGHKQEQVEIILVDRVPKQMTDYTLYLPLYGSASKIEIGLAPGAKIEAPTPQAITKPVLFYGSSITQGGCASRPGNAYTTMLCRAIDAPQINLGFSGSGKGEIAVARAISDLDLAAFIMDYDHNAPSIEHLKQTHEPFFKAIREKHPDLPIIIMSRCNFKGYQYDIARRDVIRNTYENAVKAGDKHVWFIDGETLFGKEDRDACTVDNTHPNDLGFYRMYKTVLPVLKEAISPSKKAQL